MEKVIFRLGVCGALMTLVFVATSTGIAKAQLPPDPVNIGLPPTPKPIGLPPDPVDVGLPRFPKPMGLSPTPATRELLLATPPVTSNDPSASGCRLASQATIKTDTLKDGRLTVPVTVEGHPLSFLVDTGGTGTTIKGEEAKELNLAANHTSLRILGVAGSTLTDYVISSSFSVGDLNIKNLPIYLETRALSQADGTLAPDVMRDYDLDIDFGRNTLSLTSPSPCPGATNWTTTGSINIPIDVTGDGHIRFPVKIDGYGSMATLDTGSAVSLISMKAAAALGIDLDASKLKLIRDTGQYQISSYPFQTLVFGRVLVRNPPIAIVSDNFTKGLGADLLLGTNILRHMHLHIAYGDKRLYVTAAQSN